jgi:hypothetical protein
LNFHSLENNTNYLACFQEKLFSLLLLPQEILHFIRANKREKYFYRSDVIY